MRNNKYSHKCRELGNVCLTIKSGHIKTDKLYLWLTREDIYSWKMTTSRITWMVQQKIRISDVLFYPSYSKWNCLNYLIKLNKRSFGLLQLYIMNWILRLKL